jgi:hypothetical protein
MFMRFTLKALVALAVLALTGEVSAIAVTLGAGLDNTNLAWTTGGSQGWYATNAPAIPAFDGFDATSSGNITHDQDSWIETTVAGPGALSFWWSVSSEADHDFLQFLIDGVEQEAISGDVFPAWQYRVFAITNGPHTLRWRYVKDESVNSSPDAGYLDTVKYVAGPKPTLGEALGQPYWGWQSGGNANPTFWSGQTNVYRADGLATESGEVTYLQESWMEATVFGVTNVSFWWKVSSEEGYDFLKFSVDGTNLFSISGEMGWQLKTNILLSPGIHTLRWAYTNDDVVIAGQNRGWVDEVIFQPLAPPGQMTLSPPVRQPDGQVQFTLNYELGRSCEIQYATNLAATSWQVLLRTNTSAGTTLITDTGASNSSAARFYRAKAP